MIWIEKEKDPEKKWWLARIRTADPEYYNCPPYPLSFISNTFRASLIITMILMWFLKIPVSPIYINVLFVFNGKSLPTFVNRTIYIRIIGRHKHLLLNSNVHIKERNLVTLGWSKSLLWNRLFFQNIRLLRAFACHNSNTKMNFSKRFFQSFQVIMTKRLNAIITIKHGLSIH